MKYSKLISYLKFTVYPNRDRIKKEAIKSYKKRTVALITAIVAAITMLSGGIYLGVMNISMGKDSDIPENLRALSPITSVSATSYKGSVITTDSKLLVTTKTPITKKKFCEIFEISPKTDYSVKKTSGNTFSVSFDKPLLSNTLYTVTSNYGSRPVYRWAFQTAEVFGISKAYPENGYIAQNESVSIEFTHSNVENFEESFSITPSVSGTFAHYGKKWVFIPSVELEANILYTVTVSKNVCGGNNETLNENFSFTFSLPPTEEQSYIKLNSSSDDLLDCFSTKTVPFASLSYKNADISKAEVTVYRVNTAEEYINIHKKHVSSFFISSAIADEFASTVKSTTFTSTPKIISNENKAYIYYPDTFDNGYYISEIIIGEKTLYHLFQVTDLVVYSLTSGGDYTVWLNSADTSKPVVSASVTLEGFDTALTNANGIAEFQNVQTADKTSRYMTVSAAGTYGKYVSRLPCTQSTYSQYYQDITCYLSTDSEMYSPGDVVKVWGFTAFNSGFDKSKGTFKLYNSLNDEYIDITLDENGSFEAEFTVSQDTFAKNAEISLMYDETELYSANFEIADCTQPIYRLQIDTDKKAYFDGDTVNFTIKSVFADGSYAPYVTFLTDDGNSVTTNEYGTAVLSAKAEYSQANQSDPAYISIRNFTVTQPDRTVLSFDCEYAVFKSNIYIDAQYKLTDSGDMLDIKVNSVDTKLINADINSSDSFKGKPLDTIINAELHKVSYTKKEKQSYFSPSDATVHSVYEYIESDKLISSHNIYVRDGKTSLQIPDIETDASKYYYMLSVPGSEHDNAKSVIYIYDNAPIQSDYDYTLSTEKNEYSANETVYADILNDGIIVKDGTLLLSLINGDIVNNIVFNNLNDISFTFDELYSPDVYVIGAYFDGKSIKYLDKALLCAKKEQLSVQITADKNVYKPGEKVTLNILTKDQNGVAVPASVNINVKDSNISAAFPEPYELYNTVYPSQANSVEIYRCTSSYIYVPADKPTQQLPPAAKNNTVAVSEVSPYCGTVTTDETGKAALDFTLPDSINEWHIIAKACTSQALVGMSQLNIYANEDFYISADISDTVKSDDDAVALFSFNLSQTAECKYTLTLYKDDVTVLTKTGAAETNTVITENFGKLESGSYKLRFTAKASQYADAAEYKFTIKNSYIEADVSEKTFLEYEYTLEQNQFSSDVTAILYDEELEFYNSILETLSALTCETPQKIVSSKIAAALLNGSAPDITSVRNQVQLNTSDICSAAAITAVAGEYLNKQQLVSFFEDILFLTSDDTNKICCYYALASLGMPVLSELNTYKEKAAFLTNEQQIYLALAYAYAGDYNSAYDIYTNYIVAQIKTANGVSHIAAGSTSDANVYLTALTTQLAGKLSVSQGKELAKYIFSYDNAVSKYCLELLTFAQNFVPILEGKNEITIQYANGQKQTVIYKRTERAFINIPYENTAGTVFKAKSGVNMLKISGIKSTEQMQESYGSHANNDFITITAQNEIYEHETAEITVNISISQKYSCERFITLQLPCSLKYISSELSSDDGYCVPNGSKLRVYFNKNTLSFKIKSCAQTSGSFKIEPAIFADGNKKFFIASDASELIIAKKAK